MAAAYNLEPAPTAKVLLSTTSGDILLELFAKQTPLASRNFLQHCLDGYYTNTIFHRLVPGFVIQGGDPTGTGEGGESIYTSNPSGTFADEFHSRLKFNRRGLLGMANSGRKDDNASQFFITLAKTEELDGRNTMFGRVVGDTIFNVVKMAEAEVVEGTERPMYPTKILGAEVLVNPFENMVARERKQVVDEGRKEAVGKKRGKKRGERTLLSFGEEEGEDGDEPVVVKKAKFNTKLVTEAPEAPANVTPTRTSPPPQKAKPAAPPQAPSQPKDPSKPSPPKDLPPRSPTPPSRSPTPPPTLLAQTLTSIASLTTSLKRPLPPPPKEPKKQRSSAAHLLGDLPPTSTRARKRGAGGGSGKEDRQALEIFNAFRKRLESAGTGSTEEKPTRDTTTTTTPPEPTNKPAPPDKQEEEEESLCDLHFLASCLSCNPHLHSSTQDPEEDDNDTAWLSHHLTFAKERRGRESEWQRSGEGLDVEDPWGVSSGAGREKGKKAGGRAWDNSKNSGGRAWDGKNSGSSSSGIRR
jgi:peptidyl-prolyl cis-trans isomerase SDCCAG10